MEIGGEEKPPHFGFLLKRYRHLCGPFSLVSPALPASRWTTAPAPVSLFGGITFALELFGVIGNQLVLFLFILRHRFRVPAFFFQPPFNEVAGELP